MNRIIGALSNPVRPSMRIAFIGGGNMATALHRRPDRAGPAAGDVVVVEPLDAQRARLAERFAGWRPRRCRGRADSRQRAGRARRQAAADARGLPSLAPFVDGVAAVLSIAAGTRIRDITRWLGGYARIIRAMPNTPALIGAGITGVYAPPTVDASRPREPPTPCLLRPARSSGANRKRCSMQSPASRRAVPPMCSIASRRSSRPRERARLHAGRCAQARVRDLRRRRAACARLRRRRPDVARAGHVERRHDRARHRGARTSAA